MILKIGGKDSKKLICSLIHCFLRPFTSFYESLRRKALIECNYALVRFVSLSLFECNWRRVFRFAIFVSGDGS